LSELLDIATQTIELARKAGATGAECTCSEGENFSVDIRLNEVETLTQSASRAAGLRVMVGQFTGSSYTSDLTREGLAKLVASAMELAAVTTEDPLAGLPDPQDLGSFQGDLDLFSDDIERLAPQDRIEMALRAERAAMEFDPRITNSDGAGFSSFRGVHAFANSLQFAGEYRSSYCSISCVPVAKQGEKMERDYWSSSARGLAQLESPEHVGQTAAERTVRRLGAVKAVTQKAVVIFEPRVARSFAGSLFEAIEGRAIYRDSSFLNGKLGEKIASLSTNLVDDGTMPRLFGSQPFDDEGVATRRTVVIRNGVLETYLLNTYSARKLDMRTTGNASRGITGNAGVGHGNFYLEAGQRSPGELIRSLSNGFYVTELIGSGVNISTGDYSRGATGLWIENGQLTYPVSEVTIAGTLQEMLASLEPANDLEFRSSVASPTLLVGEMTVGGK
jgi:PmbA protein